MKRSWILLLFVTVFLPAAPCRAADKEQPLRYDAGQPISVTADRLEADDAARRMRFLGNVVARQGEVTIYASELTVFYQEGSRDVERVEASGDVRITQGNRVATGQKGTFYRQEGRVVLTGSARVHQGEDFVEGDEITVLLGEEKSIVQSRQGSRVNATFHPRQEPRQEEKR